MKTKAYTINAFAKTAQGGNPASVVFDADSLSDEEMKHIAAAIGFSETAFVSHSGVPDFKLRFSPQPKKLICAGMPPSARFLRCSHWAKSNPAVIHKKPRPACWQST